MKRRSIAEIRREEIIVAFINVMSKKGFSNATIREVTEAAGFSQGMLHHYFSDKQAMIMGVLEYITTIYFFEIEKLVQKDTSATNKIKSLYNLPFNSTWFGMDYSKVWMEFWLLSKTNANIQDAIKTFYRKVKMIIAGIILEGIQSGEFKKVNHEVMANVLIGTLEGMYCNASSDPDGTPFRSSINNLKKMVLDHLAP